LRDLVGVLGGQLTTLKVETVLSTFVPLSVIGRHCPNLSELQGSVHSMEFQTLRLTNIKLYFFGMKTIL